MRVCPQCHSQINNPDSSFCFVCGKKVAGEADLRVDISTESTNDNTVSTIAKEVIQDKPKILPTADQKTKKWNNFVMGSNALALLFAIFSFGVFFRTGFTKSDNILSPSVSINNVEIAEEGLEISLEEEVNKSEYYGIVPESTILYVESSNLEELLKNKLSDEQKKYLEDTYELKFSDLLIFMRSDFAYVKKDGGTWAVITKTGGVDFFDRTYAKYQDNKTNNAPMLTSRVGEFLVFSESEDYIKEMDNVNNEILLGLANSSGFISSLGGIKGAPVFFAYSPSSDYLGKQFEEDLKDFNLEKVLEFVGKVEGNGIYITKDTVGYSAFLLN